MTNACPIQSCLPGDLSNRESWFPHQHLDVDTFAKHVPKAIGEGEGEKKGGFWRNFAVSRAVRGGPRAAGPPFCPFLERVETPQTSFIYERQPFL